MKIVLDTNVLVAGLLTPFGPCGEMMRMVSSGELILCLDARILAEYHDVLHRPKFGFSGGKVDLLLDYLEYQGHMAASSPLPVPLPDRDDEPFLEVAIAGQAACLVTGNRVHFPSRLCCGIKVLAPSDFLLFYKKQKQKKTT